MASVSMCSSFGCSTYTVTIDAVTNNGDGTATVEVSGERQGDGAITNDVGVNVYIAGHHAGGTSMGFAVGESFTGPAAAGDTVTLELESPGYFGDVQTGTTTATVPPAPGDGTGGTGDETDPVDDGDGSDGGESEPSGVRERVVNALEPLTQPITDRTDITPAQAVVAVVVTLGAMAAVAMEETSP